jgi:hypothetical protein
VKSELLLRDEDGVNHGLKGTSTYARFRFGVTFAGEDSLVGVEITDFIGEVTGVWPDDLSFEGVFTAFTNEL